MKKIYKNTVVVMIAIAFAALYSCANDDLGSASTDSPESLSMNFSLSSAKKIRSTRALPTEAGDHDGTFNENIVNTLDLFFFQGDVLKHHVPSTQLTMTEISATQKNIVIPVTSGLKVLVDATNPVYDVYVVANNTADLTAITIGSSLNDLKSILFSTPDFVTKGGETAQTTFVMDGKLVGKNIKTTSNMGTVELKRAASKVRLRIVEIQDKSGDGYLFDPTTMVAQARLVHFLDKSTLLQEGNTPSPFPADATGWKTTDWRDINTPSGAGLGGNTSKVPFYAYANDWNEDTGRETYIELKVPFKKDNVTKDYYYIVPITPYVLSTPNADAEPHLHKMERDFLYDIAVKINHVGVPNEPPVELEGNYIITDWEETEVKVQIFMFNYLMVKPDNAIMANTNTIELDFLASVYPVQYKDLKVTYTYVDSKTGQEVTKEITAADGAQYATITINNDTKKITISSAVPINYIPKDIVFTAYTQPSASLTVEQIINIKQLSSTYFTTEKGTASSLRPTGEFDPYNNEGHLKNKHMYMVTSLAPDGLSKYRWGFPPVDDNGLTINNAAVAKMISPKFMMASQLGATAPKSFEAAKTHCQNYTESTTINGTTVTYDDWRLPTEAEIAYIDDLQHKPANILGYLMGGNYYWDAYSANNAYKMQKPNKNTATATSAHIRCIRDIKD